ncbi:MAG: hypothetical protein QW459_06045 [Sulfolobales archaeon]
MSLSTAEIKVRCYIGEWIDFEGVRVLLHKLKYEERVTPTAALDVSELDAVFSSLVNEGRLPGALRSILNVSKLKSDCDLALIDFHADGTQFSYLISSKRVKCVPLAPVPDLVKSLEVLSKSLDAASVEVDALQRSMLTSSKKQLEPGYYTACLVGEVVSSSTIALGIELLNYGLRTVMANELKETSVREESIQVSRSRRKKKKKSRRKKKRKRS